MENLSKKILNYTHHTVTIISQNGRVQIPRNGTARSSTTRKIVDYVDFAGVQVPVNETTFGNVEGLPPERDDTIIIVSGITASALKGKRNDLYMVDEPIRDNSGKIIGCRSLATNTQYGDGIDYKAAFDLMYQYYDSVSDEEKERIDSQLKELGL
jgi:hypothetical protein